MATANERFFLIHKVDGKSLYARNFPPLENNVVLKVILGAVLERCIVEGRTKDLELFLGYILALRQRFTDKKYYDMEIIGTETFKA